MTDQATPTNSPEERAQRAERKVAELEATLERRDREIAALRPLAGAVASGRAVQGDSALLSNPEATHRLNTTTAWIAIETRGKMRAESLITKAQKILTEFKESDR